MRVRVGCEMTYELGQATPMLAILTREQRKMCSRLSAKRERIDNLLSEA
jgi:hypothetical protein